MIEYECPVCWSQGPHRVVRDTGEEADAVCEACGCVMHVVLYDNKQEVPDRAKD